MSKSSLLEISSIAKSYGPVVALKNASLEVQPGEIHALLGENGAGKSTLMNVLFGLYQPDAGEIRVKGQKVDIANPNIANDSGIGMVHQHFMLVENFTVTENIILGNELTKGGVIDKKVAAMRTLGVPYKVGYEKQAKADAEKQATEIAESIATDIANSLPENMKKSFNVNEETKKIKSREIVALIAYLQRLGKDISGKK